MADRQTAGCVRLATERKQAGHHAVPRMPVAKRLILGIDMLLDRKSFLDGIPLRRMPPLRGELPCRRAYR